jgi:hypothetical protein
MIFVALDPNFHESLDAIGLKRWARPTRIILVPEAAASVTSRATLRGP